MEELSKTKEKEKKEFLDLGWRFGVGVGGQVEGRRCWRGEEGKTKKLEGK